MNSASNGSTSVTYGYDMTGVRTSKTVGSTTHNYIYASGKLIRETYGSTTLDFLYDQNGNPFAMIHNGTPYYYILNLQGDVVRMVNASGTTVATYQYDAWGRLLSSSGTMASTNPLRYRGYYYDSETGFYYLQSRYYDPEIGRFINADQFTSTGQDFAGYNMFAYCGNNPITRSDDGGEFWNIVIGATVGGLVSALTTAVQTFKETGKVDVGKTVISGIVGVIGGGVAATGLGMVAQAGITAAATFVGDVATQRMCEGLDWGQVNLVKAGHNALVAGLSSIVGSIYGSITSSGYSLTGEALMSAGQDKLLTGYIRQSAGQSYSKLLNQGTKLIEAGIRYLNTGRGISSVTGTLLTWGAAQEYSWS